MIHHFIYKAVLINEMIIQKSINTAIDDPFQIRIGTMRKHTIARPQKYHPVACYPWSRDLRGIGAIVDYIPEIFTVIKLKTF